jgi:hypothetical protein
MSLHSTLQERLRHPGTKSRIRISTSVHDFLDDFRCLTTTLTERPTKITELLPRASSTIGAIDAAKDEMGGVHLLPNPDCTMHPILWRKCFPVGIINWLVTDANPTGDLTIGKFELAATVARHGILVQAVDLQERTPINLHDNTATVYWQRKGSTTTTTNTTTNTKEAYYMLRLQALHQRYHHCVPRHDYLPDKLNAMADY